MRTAESIELLRDLRSGLLDLVVCEREPADSMRRGLHSALIEQTHLVVTARPDLHPASDWHDVELAQFRPTSAYRWEIDAYLREHDLKPRIVVEADDAMLLVESALRRRCIAIVPRAAARDALASGRLSTIAEIDSAETAIHALYQDTSSVRFTRRAVELLVSSSRAVGSGAPS